jgi:hypothetical protein
MRAMRTHVIRFKRRTEAVVLSKKGMFKGEDLIDKGFETECRLMPYVIEEDGRFIEVADIEIPGGETWAAVPCKNFEFVENEDEA